MHRSRSWAGDSGTLPLPPLPWEAEPTGEADYDLERQENRLHARMLGMGFADLLRFEPSAPAFQRLPTWVIHQHKVVPLGEVAGILYCAIADLSDRDVLHVVSECADGPVRFVLATPRDIEQTLWAPFAAKPLRAEVSQHLPAEETQAGAL